MGRNYAERDKKEYDRLHIARRTMVYVVRTLMLLIAGVLVCALAFFTTERMSNLYILTSEGMALRADCVLGDGDTQDLEEYFLLTWITQDAQLATTAYENYEISSYNYDIEIEQMSVMPWSSTGTVTAVETVSVKGTIKTDLIEEGKTVSDYPIPAWATVRYRIHFINNGERWYISELEVLEENPAVAPLRTADLSVTPRPMASPTPSPEVVEIG